jgi:predicted nucleic-acid-binding Zn-ribbon protein
MLEFIGGLVLGGAISWFITHSYYVRSSRDQRAVFGKLSSEIKALILSDKRASLTVVELNAILRDRVINDGSRDELPYKVCPKCGSNNIDRDRDYIVDAEMGDDGMPVYTGTPYKTIRCENCGWTDDEIRRDVDRFTE